VIPSGNNNARVIKQRTSRWVRSSLQWDMKNYKKGEEFLGVRGKSHPQESQRSLTGGKDLISPLRIETLRVF
jgi:hypothetical protein